MSNTKKDGGEQVNERTCFVIMPISDTGVYPQGHFKRVYDYLIKPACIEAGFTPIRADDIKGTNAIVIDILRRIISSDMAICDLSAKNPNVLYELGVRQSFDLPVTFIRDELTERIFDIQGFRDTAYPSSLRIDEVETAISSIASNIRETFENKGNDINSIVELLGISKAVVKDPITLSGESTILLAALNEIQGKLNKLTQNTHTIQPASSIFLEGQLEESSFNHRWESPDYVIVNTDQLKIGDTVEHRKFGTGNIKSIGGNGHQKKAVVQFIPMGMKTLFLSLANLKVRESE